MQTEMACGEDAIPGLVTLESNWLEVEDARWLNVYAPKGWILELAK